MKPCDHKGLLEIST